MMKKILFLVFAAVAVNTYAQKATNKLTFTKGQKLEMVAETKSMISQEVMGQSMDMNISASITRLFDVEEVKNNTATIEHKIKRIQFNFDAMGQTQSFDSEKEEDMKSEMGKNMEKSLKNKYTMTVDDQGNVVSVKVDDDNPNKADSNAQADMMTGMMSQFLEGLEVPKTGDPTAFKVLPNRNLSKGQTWSDTTKGEKGSIKYTVADINNNEIILDYESETSMDKEQEAMGMTANINMKNKATGRITVDRKTGLLKEKTINIDGTGVVEAGGQTIPMTLKTTGKVTVKPS